MLLVKNRDIRRYIVEYVLVKLLLFFQTVIQKLHFPFLFFLQLNESRDIGGIDVEKTLNAIASNVQEIGSFIPFEIKIRNIFLIVDNHGKRLPQFGIGQHSMIE